MDTVFIPTESDFKRWIKEALKDILDEIPTATSNKESVDEEPLYSRKEIAFMFKISLVTLHKWIKKGMPSHKQEGRVYFLKSEVLAYLKQKTPIEKY